jgi:hypothetical protein
MIDYSAEVRRNALWALTRIAGSRARGAVRSALDDQDESVRQVALHSISLWRDGESVPRLMALLAEPSLQNRRAAAEALGRIGDRKAVPSLLQAAAGHNDRALEHSITYALIEIADRDGTAAGLKSSNLATRRAALIALDQMDHGKLDVQTVSAELTSPDARMKEAAWWIAGRHPEWGGALAGFLRDRLSAQSMTEAEGGELVQQLARFARTKPVQELLAERLQDRTSPADYPAGHGTRRTQGDTGLLDRCCPANSRPG